MLPGCLTPIKCVDIFIINVHCRVHLVSVTDRMSFLHSNYLHYEQYVQRYIYSCIYIYLYSSYRGGCDFLCRFSKFPCSWSQWRFCAKIFAHQRTHNRTQWPTSLNYNPLKSSPPTSKCSSCQYICFLAGTKVVVRTESTVERFVTVVAGTRKEASLQPSADCVDFDRDKDTRPSLLAVSQWSIL